MLFIGDVHGCFDRYEKLVTKFNSPSLQVGDMGNGFPVRGVLDVISRSPDLDLCHKFIRGNHDDPKVCREHPNYLGDYGYHEKSGIFYVGGGFSIDKEYRVENISWWENEEIQDEFFDDVIRLYSKFKPKIIVSHECPTMAKKLVLSSGCIKEINSKTENLLQILFNNYSPDIWIFGHYHKKIIKTLKGTEFICLGEFIDSPPDQCVFDIPEISWE